MKTTKSVNTKFTVHTCTSWFILHGSYFTLLISYFRVHTSYFTFHTLRFKRNMSHFILHISDLILHITIVNTSHFIVFLKTSFMYGRPGKVKVHSSYFKVQTSRFNLKTSQLLSQTSECTLYASYSLKCYFLCGRQRNVTFQSSQFSHTSHFILKNTGFYYVIKCMEFKWKAAVQSLQFMLHISWFTIS